jgi:signal transduction histidine kinase
MIKADTANNSLVWRWTSDEERERVRAAESYTEFITAGLLSLAVAATLGYVYLLFEPLAPAPVLNLWAGLMAAWVVYVLAGTLFVLIRKPKRRGMKRMEYYGKVSAIAYDLLLAASVWMLLPYAPESLQLMMVVFYAAAICGQAIATAESFGTVSFGVLTVLGSTAAFFIVSDNAYGLPVGVFILGFGGLLLMAAIIIRNAVRSAIKAKFDAEHANANLVVALQAVADARDAKQRFIAAATHDLRQPLQAAGLYLRPLLQARADYPQVVRPVEGLERSLRAADDLIEDMTTFVRLDAQTLQPSLETVAVGPILLQVAAMLEADAAEKGAHIRTVPSRLAVTADPLWLERVVRNLVNNAIRHAAGRRILIGVRANRAQGALELWCVDDGRGIAEADRDRIFDEYSRGGDAAARATSGMGLGLALSRLMAELMGGSLNLRPTWTRGALFCLCLKLAPAIAVRADTSRGDAGHDCVSRRG